MGVLDLSSTIIDGKSLAIQVRDKVKDEVNILEFLKEASKKNFKIVLPVIKSSNKMCFKKWVFKQPLYVNKFGILG